MKATRLGEDGVSAAGVATEWSRQVIARAYERIVPRSALVRSTDGGTLCGTIGTPPAARRHDTR